MENFKSKTTEELAAMNADEQVVYFEARKAHEKAQNDAVIAELKEQIKTADKSSEIEAFKSELAEAKAQMSNLDETIISLKQASAKQPKTNKANTTFIAQLKASISKAYTDRKNQITNAKDESILQGQKSTITVPGSHTGNDYITQINEDLFRDDIPVPDYSILDMIPQGTTEEEIAGYRQVEGRRVPDFFVGENEDAVDLDWKTKMITASIKFIRPAIKFTRQMMKGRLSAQTRAEISQLPIHMANQITDDLISDIATYATNFTTGYADVTITAGDIASQASVRNGKYTELTFGSAHGITARNCKVALTTPAGTYYVKSVSGEFTLVIDKTYSAGATTTWAGTITYPLKNSIADMTEDGALSALVTLGKQAGYMPNLIIVNPETFEKLKQLKGDDNHYMNQDGTFNPVPPSINGATLISSDAIVPGVAMVGDMMRGCELLWNEPLTITTGADMADKRMNQEQVLGSGAYTFKVVNPYAFIYTSIADAKTYFSA